MENDQDISQLVRWKCSMRPGNPKPMRKNWTSHPKSKNRKNRRIGPGGISHDQDLGVMYGDGDRVEKDMQKAQEFLEEVRHWFIN